MYAISSAPRVSDRLRLVFERNLTILTGTSLFAFGACSLFAGIGLSLFKLYGPTYGITFLTFVIFICGIFSVFILVAFYTRISNVALKWYRADKEGFKMFMNTKINLIKKGDEEALKLVGL